MDEKIMFEWIPDYSYWKDWLSVSSVRLLYEVKSDNKFSEIGDLGKSMSTQNLIPTGFVALVLKSPVLIWRALALHLYETLVVEIKNISYWMWPKTGYIWIINH